MFNKEEHGHLFPLNGDYRYVQTATAVPHGSEIIPSDVTQEDILLALRQANSSSATGNSGISFEHLKRISH